MIGPTWAVWQVQNNSFHDGSEQLNFILMTVGGIKNSRKQSDHHNSQPRSRTMTTLELFRKNQANVSISETLRHPSRNFFVKSFVHFFLFLFI